MRITELAQAHGRRALGWIFGCAVTILPMTAAAQISIRPTDRPIVTAENERWSLEGQPITFSGSVYYPSGAAVFFNPYEMVRSGDYRGVPLYSMKTREPYAVVYVPVERGLMQPYERRRTGELAGTVGSSAPSFPVDRDSEATAPDTGLQAAAPPVLREAYPAYGYGTTDERPTAMPPAEGTIGTGSVPPRGPLTTALKPTGLNAFYIEYKGQRWFATGPAVLLDPAKFTRSGDYHGFAVYLGADTSPGTVYVAVASTTTSLLTPYSTRKQP
jgi:hypothetical protein